MYKIPEGRIKKRISPNNTIGKSYRHYKGRFKETHLYQHISEGEFYDKVEKILYSQTNAFKLNIQLGYLLIDKVDGEERRYHPNDNTQVFTIPITINARKDIGAAVSSIRNYEISQNISYGSSAYRVKHIDSFKLILYNRQHALGSSEAVIPEEVKAMKGLVNFKKTNNKCMFFCIAAHLLEEGASSRYIIKDVKSRFEQYCEFTKQEYSLSLYKRFQPINLLQFDTLENCFKVDIDVYEVDEEFKPYNIRPSSTNHGNKLNILSCSNHAIYIKDIDLFFKRHECGKCRMLFTDKRQLQNHMKNRCDEFNISSFPKLPTVYKPCENKIKLLYQRYGIKSNDFYMDHFITYDLECIQLPIIEKREVMKTEFIATHIPVSVSICDSLTKEVRCFVNEDPKTLMKEMFDYIETVYGEIWEYNMQKFKVLDEKIYAAHMRELAKTDPSERKLKSLASDSTYLDDACKQIIIAGYNSGKYDLNMIKNEFFEAFSNFHKGGKLSAIKNPGYMSLSGEFLKMVDVMNYIGPCSYASYLSAFLGDCKCDDKIRCLCGLGKGMFPYEWLDSFDKLNSTELPPKEAFFSSLKNTKIKEDEYERCQFIWNHYQMKSMKDFLIWYNNLDIKPFVKAIIEHRNFFKKYQLDMLMDGVSLPGLSEKIMYQTVFKDLKFPGHGVVESFDFDEDRYDGYYHQDKLAGRQFCMSIQDIKNVLKKQKYCCACCLSALDKKNASVDRIDNTKGHITDNFVISCIQCNTGRKDMNIPAYKEKKLLERNADKLVFSIDEEYGDIYDKMKANIAGGPSIIFKRYAEAGVTKIRGGSKVCKKVIGYDANALYLWCLGNEMPCGRLTTIDAYDTIIDDIKADKIFGFLECDIRVPDHLKDYFGEMTPIFKKVEIDPTEKIIGKHMFEYNESLGKNRRKASKKLIGSYFGNKILVYTPLLKWYLEHGLVIDKMYSFIKASSARPYKQFMEQVSDHRRGGDSDKTKKPLANMMKLVGNAAFGRSGMDKSKHRQVKYESNEDNVKKLREHFTFHSMDELPGVYEISMNKRRLKLNNPMHINIAIYQLAKLRMLEFYYDCLDRYFDRSDYEYLEMDTDSAYIAFSHETPFPSLIKPDQLEHYEKHKYDWFPRDQNETVAKYDMRTPGLFKEEWRGGAMISLSSKNYHCYLPDDIIVKGKTQPGECKTSSKGVQKALNRDVLVASNFKKVIDEKLTISATNRGFPCM